MEEWSLASGFSFGLALWACLAPTRAKQAQRAGSSLLWINNNGEKTTTIQPL